MGIRTSRQDRGERHEVALLEARVLDLAGQARQGAPLALEIVHLVDDHLGLVDKALLLERQVGGALRLLEFTDVLKRLAQLHAGAVQPFLDELDLAARDGPHPARAVFAERVGGRVQNVRRQPRIDPGVRHVDDVRVLPRRRGDVIRDFGRDGLPGEDVQGIHPYIAGRRLGREAHEAGVEHRADGDGREDRSAGSPKLHPRAHLVVHELEGGVRRFPRDPLIDEQGRACQLRVRRSQPQPKGIHHRLGDRVGPQHLDLRLHRIDEDVQTRYACDGHQAASPRKWIADLKRECGLVVGTLPGNGPDRGYRRYGKDYQNEPYPAGHDVPIVGQMGRVLTFALGLRIAERTKERIARHYLVEKGPPLARLARLAGGPTVTTRFSARMKPGWTLFRLLRPKAQGSRR